MAGKAKGKGAADGRRPGRSASGAKQPPPSAGKQTSVPDGTEGSSAPFLKWCRSAGLLHASSTVARLPGSGVRGVVATADIKQGQVVVQVPDEAVLMVENCRIANELEEAGLAKGVAEDPLFEVQGLVLAVMAERAAGARSAWAAYVQWIPQDLSHMPMFWTDEEQRELRGTAALDKMRGRVQTPSDAPTQVRTLWEEVVQPFILERPHLKLPHGDKGYELYRWATAAVSSYSFILGDDKYQAMVPYWDALNHTTGAVNVRLNHHTTKSGAGCLQMIATRDIKSGEELVNNYGELSQAELLRAYGYVEHHEQANLYSHVQVPLKFVLAAVAAEAAGPDAASGDAEECGSDDGGASDWNLSDDDDEEGDEEDDKEREEKEEDEEDKPGPSGRRGAGTRQPRRRGGPEAPAGGGGARAAALAAVRGLPGRLRFLRRLRLLPRTQVFKVYEGSPTLSPPTSTSNGHGAPAAAAAQARDGAAQLCEAVRLLLLPWRRFDAVRRSVLEWRPPPAGGGGRAGLVVDVGLTHGSPSANGGVAGAQEEEEQQQRGGKKKKEVKKQATVAGGPQQEEEAGRVLRVLRRVAERMQSRYTCGLEEDEAVLRSRGDGVPPWLLAAVAARAPEKRCLRALRAWATPGGGGEEAGRRVAAAAGGCWGQPRPGMFGVEAEGSDDEEGEDGEGDSGEDDEEEDGSEEGSEDAEDSDDDGARRPAPKRGRPGGGKGKGGEPDAWANKRSRGPGTGGPAGGAFKFGFEVA